MRLAWLLMLAACGDVQGGADGGLGDGGGSKFPECRPCADGLNQDTALCPSSFDVCQNDINATLQTRITCFRNDGMCYSSALAVSSACHDRCGDEEQANVERCTGVCFDQRIPCDEAALRKTDTCFQGCTDELSCALCEALGNGDHDQCLATLTNCAEDCKARYRR